MHNISLSQIFKKDAVNDYSLPKSKRVKSKALHFIRLDISLTIIIQNSYQQNASTGF